jgi:hypothetical protein
MFALLFIMVYPCLITSDEAIQIYVLTALLLQQMRACVHRIALVLFCLCLWNPTCMNFVEFKNVMHP